MVYLVAHIKQKMHKSRECFTSILDFLFHSIFHYTDFFPLKIPRNVYVLRLSEASALYEMTTLYFLG